MTARHWQVWSLAALLMTAPLAARAQDIGPALDPGLMVGWTANAAVQYDLERRAKAAERGKSQAGLNTRSLSSAMQAPGRGSVNSSDPLFTYRPSAAVRRANYARFVERSRAVDPQGAAQLEHVFKTEDLMGKADQWMQTYGLTATNVADATSVYLMSAWLASRGRSEDPDRASMRAVRDQVASAIAATPAFRKASDAQKQELSEAMIIQAIMISQYVDAAKAQPSLMAAVQNAAVSGAKNTFGFDIRQMALSARGLR
ncbi:Uncharacterised protein [Bordetella ansorpii]|uniref:Lipoprotein n=1 Tax=Bordetella ansorpii TaxID=288768 RepID=A0A157RLU1_9BORD|nr:DUF6683 family protein [Bordetella ansorpii]SAI58854.1 Uncharacterised protein [Bordetella ansorpii]